MEGRECSQECFNRAFNHRPMSTTLENTYKLRNDANQSFHIKAEVTKSYASGDEGAEITATVRQDKGAAFTYVVEFGGEFVKTKRNFTPEMYLHTALSIVCSQIESKRHSDTRLRVHRASGLTDTAPLQV